MIGGVIDLGTNTFNLLIFEKRKGVSKIIHVDRSPVGLGLGGINENLIANEAFKRGVETILRFKEVCIRYGVDELKAFGTSALRGAVNTADFCDTIKTKTNITIEVINGEREASLIYKGVASVHDFDNDSCVMDIGGGSTEFILVHAGSPPIMKSFDIGLLRIIQLFNLSDPLTSEDKQKINQFLEENTSPFFGANKSQSIIGASGSFDTFHELIYGKKFTDLSTSSFLAFSKLIKVLDRLIDSTFSERSANDSIVDLRKEMIHIAAFKTRWVIQKLGIKEAWVSPASLKEGVMMEM